MKNVRLVASDMDHTLLTEKSELPPHFGDYIHRLSEAGVYFTAASGRPMFTLEDMFHDYLDEICIISDNGAAIKVGRKNVFVSLIPVEKYQEMIHFTIENNAGIPVLCALDSGYVDERYKEHEPFFRKFFSKLTFVSDMEKISPEANKYTVFFPERNAKEYLDRVFRPVYDGQYSLTLGGEEWIDIMNVGIDKGSAIRELVRHFGLQIEETMAFGDTYNDIEMLQAVHFSYVMANAAEPMRKYAKYVADTNENYGVLKVMDELLKIKAVAVEEED